MKPPKFRDAAAAITHGDALARQGDLAGAEVAFRRAIELDRRNPFTFAMLGDMQRRQGDAGSAVRNYRAAIKLDERQAEVVELRYFGGLTNDEIAEVFQVSRRTIESDWRMARAWLLGQLGEPSS